MRKRQVLTMERNYRCTPKPSNLLEQIRKLDFAIYETVLYLDAYPNSREALDYYHKLIGQREILAQEYRLQSPLTIFDNNSTESWDWIKSPWPWKYEAN